jgi:hypothetical protein
MTGNFPLNCLDCGWHYLNENPCGIGGDRLCWHTVPYPFGNNGLALGTRLESHRRLLLLWGSSCRQLKVKSTSRGGQVQQKNREDERP